MKSGLSKQIGSTVVVALVSLALLSSCAKDDDTTTAGLSDAETTVESAITAADGVIDDQNNSSFAYLMQPSYTSVADYVRQTLLPSAYAASCARAATQSCSAGVKSITYSGCTGVNAERSFAGSVSLTYSNMSCVLTTNGDTVTRAHDVSITGPRGGVIEGSSQIHQNYLGSSLGGGGRITKTGASAYSLEILGNHKTFTRNGTTGFDISVATTSPITVTGSLARAGRVLSGGSFAVYHNVKKFTSTMTPNNLTFTSTCCYPTSGSLDVVYSGTKTGSASVVFNGCGSASVNTSGSSESITLAYCE